jgi:hypothetical protein
VSEPRRLIEADDEFERDLILAAHGDQPSPRALERTLVSIGVGLAVIPAGAVATAAPGAAVGSKLGLAVLAKWLLGGLALGIVAAGGLQLGSLVVAPPTASTGVTRPADTAPVAPRSQDHGAGSSERALPTLDGTPAPPAPLPARPIVPNLAATVRAPAEAAHAGAPPERTLAPVPGSAERSFAVAAPAQSPTELERETTLLDAARRSLAHGDAKGALAALDGYARAFPRGALRPEASVLQVRALLAAGERSAAEALGRRIIAASPRSEHADAVRAALARTNP